MKKIINGLKRLFSDDNSINEKSVVGFLAFGMMILTLTVDIVTGVLGKTFPIHEFVYEGFMYLALGALGIASVDKIFRKNGNKGHTEVPDVHEHFPDEGEYCNGGHNGHNHSGGHHHPSDCTCGGCN